MRRHRTPRRDDRGVVAIEFVLILPFIIALIACSITLAGLFQTKSRVVGAARDGARALAIKPGVAAPTADPTPLTASPWSSTEPPCPPLTNAAYQSATPPQVTAQASTTYTVDDPVRRRVDGHRRHRESDHAMRLTQRDDSGVAKHPRRPLRRAPARRSGHRRRRQPGRRRDSLGPEQRRCRGAGHGQGLRRAAPWPLAGRLRPLHPDRSRDRERPVSDPRGWRVWRGLRDGAGHRDHGLHLRQGLRRDGHGPQPSRNREMGRVGVRGHLPVHLLELRVPGHVHPGQQRTTARHADDAVRARRHAHLVCS